MSEAVRTMASPAAIWVIVVTATCLALFMAMAALAANHFQIREHRRMRMLGMWPTADDALDAGVADPWPRLSEALMEAAGAGQPAAVAAAASWPAAQTAARHDIPGQRQAPVHEPSPAEQQEAAQYAGAPETEAPTEPIPAQRTQRTQGARGMQDAAAGRHERAVDDSAGDGPAGEMPTRPDLLAQEGPGRHAMPLPTQRTGESDRAERSLAGPAPQDDDGDEQ